MVLSVRGLGRQRQLALRKRDQYFVSKHCQQTASLCRPTFQKDEDHSKYLFVRILITLFQLILGTRVCQTEKVHFATLLEIPCVKW